MECPPLTCDNPLPLQPGDCCPRCDNDPCNFFGFPPANSSSPAASAAVSVVGHPCTYKGNSIASGHSFDDPSSRCTTCACKVIQSAVARDRVPHASPTYLYPFHIYRYQFVFVTFSLSNLAVRTISCFESPTTFISTTYSSINDGAAVPHLRGRNDRNPQKYCQTSQESRAYLNTTEYRVSAAKIH